MNDLNFNIYNIIILTGIIQGFIFSLVILFNRKYRTTTNVFMALTVLSLSFSNFQYWTLDVEVKYPFDIFNYIRIPCDALITPSFFLFIVSYLRGKINYRLIGLLSIPFFISLIFSILLSLQLVFSNSTFILLNTILEFSSLAFNLTLIIAIILKIKKYELKKKQYDIDDVKLETKWLKKILYIGVVGCIFWFGSIIIMESEHNKGFEIYYPLWIGISFIVYWISYASIVHSRIYHERISIRESEVLKREPEDVPKLGFNKTNEKLFDDILSWIKTSKVYLNPNLDLNKVAEEFEISNGYISQLLNSHSELNFKENINQLRIEEAKEMLSNKEYDNYTILSIAYESGFNSKSSFYSAFKKFTGQSPIDFKKGVRKN